MNNEIPPEVLHAMQSFACNCPTGYADYLSWLANNAALIGSIDKLLPYQLSLLLQNCWAEGMQSGIILQTMCSHHMLDKIVNMKRELFENPN